VAYTAAFVRKTIAIVPRKQARMSAMSAFEQFLPRKVKTDERNEQTNAAAQILKLTTETMQGH
jgi:hypothetical protein